MSLAKGINTVKGTDHKVEKRTPTDDERKIHVRNKFNPTPSEIQRQQMVELLKHPEREIVIPKTEKRTLSPPPELVSNIAGSSAGAGSGEFHVYKQARRKEFERMKIFEEEEIKEQTEKDFERQKTLLDSKDNAKTEKNRLKRLKRRGNKGKGGNTPQQLQTMSNSHMAGGAKSSITSIGDESILINGSIESSSSLPAPTISEPKGLEIVEDDF